MNPGWASLLDNPKHWRARAEEARTIADALTVPESIWQMQEIANTYDLIAEQAEERLRKKQRKSET